MQSALRPYITTGLAVVGSSVLAVAPLSPPPEGAVTRPTTLAANVITINPSPDAVDINDALQGYFCESPNNCEALDYLPLWSAPGQFGFGVAALNEALANIEPGDETIVLGFSSGSLVASQWLEQHAGDPDAPLPEDLTFVVIGDPNRRYGGANGMFGGVWPDSEYKVINIARQYDPAADMPTNLLNVLAVANAYSGFLFNHLGDSYTDVDLDDPDNIVWEEGNTTYYFVPTPNIPLLEPLRILGLDELADQLNDPLKALIELGYDRQFGGGDEPSINNIGNNLVQMVANIPYYAIQGMNRFSAAMAASGSWWVYTPTNVLGWDPANPEMTMGLTDWLLGIPALSGPMGRDLNLWLQANLPMHAGCTGFPPCDDPDAILNDMFKVNIWDFFGAGYTFPKLNNPVSEEEGAIGQAIEGSVGPEVEWSGQTYTIDPFAGLTSLWDFLIAPPEGIKSVTIEDQLEAVRNLVDALIITWNPFVPMSYVWNPEYTPFAYIARPFAKILCPECNPIDPFWPVGATEDPAGQSSPQTLDGEGDSTAESDAAAEQPDDDAADEGPADESSEAEDSDSGSNAAELVSALRVSADESDDDDAQADEVDEDELSDEVSDAEVADEVADDEVSDDEVSDDEVSDDESDLEEAAAEEDLDEADAEESTNVKDGNKAVPGQVGTDSDGDDSDGGGSATGDAEDSGDALGSSADDASGSEDDGAADSTGTGDSGADE